MNKYFGRKAAAVAVAAGTLLGIGAIGATGASAATPSCGTSCVEPYTLTFGAGYIADVLQQKAAVGQEVMLYRASNSDPAEDFVAEAQGTVHSFYHAGLVSAQLDLHYRNNPAYELEYAPYGRDTGLCIGSWPGNVEQNWKVRLEPCGVGPSTVLVAANLGTSTSTNGDSRNYINVINGSDTNFSHPYVLTYPANSNPSDSPRPWPVWAELTHFSDGTTPSNQQFSACLGIVGSGSFGCAGAGLPGNV